MNKGHIAQTLREFADESLDIDGVSLVSSQGQLLTTALGMDENSTLVIAGMMLHLAGRVREECQWQTIEQISIRSQAGYITLIPCTEDSFLLVKTVRTPSGFFQQEIKETVRKLQVGFHDSEVVTVTKQRSACSSTLLSLSSTPTPATLILDERFTLHCQQELAQFIGPIAALICQRILKENPELSDIEFLEALVQQIPDKTQALAFRQRFLAGSQLLLQSQEKSRKQAQSSVPQLL